MKTTAQAPSRPNSLLKTAALAALAAAVLAGCASSGGSGGIEGVALDDAQLHSSMAPFMEAKDRTQVRCTSKTPLSTQRPLAEVIFTCEDLGAEATLPEMKDAGWRMVGLDIGHESHEGELITMPLTITVIKLF